MRWDNWCPRKLTSYTRLPVGGILEDWDGCSGHPLRNNTLSLGVTLGGSSIPREPVRTGMLQFFISLKGSVFPVSFLTPREHFIFQRFLIKQLKQLISWDSKTQQRFLMKFSYCWTRLRIFLIFFLAIKKIYSRSAWIVHHEWPVVGLWSHFYVSDFSIINGLLLGDRLTLTEFALYGSVVSWGPAVDVFSLLDPTAKLWLDTWLNIVA